MDLFTTNVLTAIVQDLRVPQTGLLDRYFTGSIVEDSEEIHFDVDTTPRRIAPFVSPLVAGQVVRSRGFQTSTFKPAYVKDKRVFTPTRAIKRVMGEKMGGGQYSPEQRMMILVVIAAMPDVPSKISSAATRPLPSAVFTYRRFLPYLDHGITARSDMKVYRRQRPRSGDPRRARAAEMERDVTGPTLHSAADRSPCPRLPSAACTRFAARRSSWIAWAVRCRSRCR